MNWNTVYMASKLKRTEKKKKLKITFFSLCCSSITAHRSFSLLLHFVLFHFFCSFPLKSFQLTKRFIKVASTKSTIFDLHRSGKKNYSFLFYFICSFIQFEIDMFVGTSEVLIPKLRSIIIYLHLFTFNFFSFFFSFENCVALGNLGSILSTMGRYDEAKDALQMALKYRPNMADVHYNL